MPQFDFTTYSSQIFWFAICFGVLYFFMSKIILPRIRNLTQERLNVVNTDLSAADALDREIADLQISTEKLRRSATAEYQTKLDDAAKSAAKERDKKIEELKEKLDEASQKSRQELRDFVKKSQENSVNVIQDLVKIIKEKILKNA